MKVEQIDLIHYYITVLKKNFLVSRKESSNVITTSLGFCFPNSTI